MFQKILKKSGKKYQIDNNIPQSLFVNILFNRVLMLIRGLIFFRKKVFIGGHCNFKNKKSITLGLNTTIESFCTIDGYAKNGIIIGNNSKIGAYSFVTTTSHMSKYGKGLTIGNNSACGRYCEFGASGGIEIGNDVIMGSYISFHSENHNYLDKNLLIREQGVSSKGIKIGNNIWVGSKVTFLDGCKVGDNCVIASGAVVNSIYPDNVIIGGVPAKILKHL